MRKTDINKYGHTPNFEENYEFEIEQTANPYITVSKVKSIFKLIFKFIITVFAILVVSGLIVTASAATYIISLSTDQVDYDVRANKLHLTSFIYVDDENGQTKEYQRVYSTENRIWVDFKDIPQHMKNAIIAIEDKRFAEHGGVDWVRTLGAVLSLASGEDSYGGSTLTQQLIKNLTEENEVSLTRKLKEIFRSINFERKYSKDEILEAYLNVVNFGSGCRGVQAAANLYFGKNIGDCTIAECAAIAGITQNPAAYTPRVYPENNKIRREIVLLEMYEQQKISKDEYNIAMTESQNMNFLTDEEINDKSKSEGAENIRNWYIEALLNDVAEDLSKKMNVGKNTAEEMVLTQGLKIYCAMDEKAQNLAEEALKDPSIMPKSTALELGYVMMGLDGRVLATLGSRGEKTGNLLYDKANTARRQPGSTIKPIAVYAPLIELGIYNYSSIIPDKPLQVADSTGSLKNWPNNWYSGYRGQVTLQWAIEKSANAPAAQALNVLTPKVSYEFLTQKLGFTSLDIKDSYSLAPLATGGTNVGVTVRDMTAGFQIFGNGGKYNKPYMYYYVTDRNDNIILDNRSNIPTQAISPETATIMNKLLRNVIAGHEGTGRSANIAGWNIVGKTGTTNNNYDSWFIGVTPYMVSGIWTGYDVPKTIGDTAAAIRIWKSITTKYLKDKPVIDYTYSPNVVEASYCKSTGKLSKSGCPSAVGYYNKNNMPDVCNGSGVTETNDIDPSTLIDDNPEGRGITTTTTTTITTYPDETTSSEIIYRTSR